MPRTPISLTILHTNDMHAEISAISRLSRCMRQLRADLTAEGRRVFYFDAGDAEDRKIRWISATRGAAFPQVLAAMNCDLQALGNGISITYGIQAAAAAARQASYPILAANFFQQGKSPVEGFLPYVLFPIGDGIHLKVTGQAPYFPPVYSLYGVQQPYYVDCAREWLEYLRQYRGPTVLLTHLGYQFDQEITAACPEVDVLIGGHSHTTLPEGEIHNGVLVAQAGEYARFLGRVDLEVDPDSGEVLSRQARLIEIPEDGLPDPRVEQAVARARLDARQVMARLVVELPAAMPTDFQAESVFGDFAADVLRRRMKAEVGIVLSGLLPKGLPAGPVSLEQLDDACFTTANPMLSRVSGEQLRQALEDGLREDRSVAVYKSFRSSPTGIPQVSGLQIEYKPDAPDGAKIIRVWVNGQPLEPQREYLVAHTDAESDTQAAILNLAPDQILRTEVPTILREALEDDLSRAIPDYNLLTGRWIAE
jgi:2',3'-cyclic-nucleotide 2'-phosphodiesterase (5'-nucleotidase family)